MANIRIDSRYATCSILTDENGNAYLDWFEDRKFDISQFDDNVQHVVKSGDTVFNIASRYLLSQRYYWVICRANVIFNPFQKLTPGSTLLVPSLRTFRSQILGQTDT